MSKYTVTCSASGKLPSEDKSRRDQLVSGSSDTTPASGYEDALSIQPDERRRAARRLKNEHPAVKEVVVATVITRLES